MADQLILTRAQRASDMVSSFCGSWAFIAIFSGMTAIWMLLNISAWIEAFDPYPFIFFNLILTVVSTFQGPLIMMSQNRQVDRDRERDRALIRDLHDKFDNLDRLVRGLPPNKGKYDPWSVK